MWIEVRIPNCQRSCGSLAVSGGIGPFLPHVKAVRSYRLGYDLPLRALRPQGFTHHSSLQSELFKLWRYRSSAGEEWTGESWVLDEALSLTSLAYFISLFSQPSNGDNYALFFQA